MNFPIRVFCSIQLYSQRRMLFLIVRFAYMSPALNSVIFYSEGGRKIIIIIIKSGGAMFIWAICHAPVYAFSIIIMHIQMSKIIDIYTIFYFSIWQNWKRRTFQKSTEQDEWQKSEDINKHWTQNHNCLIFKLKILIENSVESLTKVINWI